MGPAIDSGCLSLYPGGFRTNGRGTIAAPAGCRDSNRIGRIQPGAE